MPKKSTARKSSLTSMFEVHESTLPNGLKIRLIPNREVPVVSLYTFFRVGSRNERPGITGISHLFEHMMFNGAKKYGPKEFDRTLESHGGHSNAYTSNDVTVYYDDFASEALEKVLDLESDRMRSLTISDKSLESEREVVKEERRMRVDNEVLGRMDEELNALVFKAHPYHWPVIGWMGDIERISKEECAGYFRTYYAPNNALLYVAGDFEVKPTLALIKRYYGNIKKGPPPEPVIDSEPEQTGERRAQVLHPAQAPSLMIGYRGPRGDDEETRALDVLQYVLSVGENSRFTRQLVYEQKVCVGAHVDWAWRFDPGVFMIYLELAPDGDAAKAEAAVTAQLAKVASEGIGERELQKAKNNLRAHLLRELSTNNGRAHALGTYEMFFGDWREGLSLAERYDSITAEQVKQAAVKYLSPHRRSTVTLVPAQAQEAA
jgi:zinc protease